MLSNAEYMSNISIGWINIFWWLRKKWYGRVWKRQYSENAFATHDLKNEVLTYILSANQRKANIRLEKPNIN